MTRDVKACANLPSKTAIAGFGKDTITNSGQDFYGPYTADAQTDPVGPESGISITTAPTTGTEHVARGGGWGSDVRICRVSYRIASPAAFKTHISGLRLAL